MTQSTALRLFSTALLLTFDVSFGMSICRGIHQSFILDSSLLYKDYFGNKGRGTDNLAVFFKDFIDQASSEFGGIGLHVFGKLPTTMDPMILNTAKTMGKKNMDTQVTVTQSLRDTIARLSAKKTSIVSLDEALKSANGMMDKLTQQDPKNPVPFRTFIVSDSSHLGQCRGMDAYAVEIDIKTPQIINIHECRTGKLLHGSNPNIGLQLLACDTNHQLKDGSSMQFKPSVQLIQPNVVQRCWENIDEKDGKIKSGTILIDDSEGDEQDSMSWDLGKVYMVVKEIYENVYPPSCVSFALFRVNEIQTVGKDEKMLEVLIITDPMDYMLSAKVRTAKYSPAVQKPMDPQLKPAKKGIKTSVTILYCECSRCCFTCCWQFSVFP
eukprot:726614_1